MKLLSSLVAVLLAGPSILPAQTSTPAATPAGKAPAIIIKVDDFGAGKAKRVSPQWQRVADFIKERKIKASIGIICDSLEADNPEYLRWIKDLHATGLVEFWLHAYEHKSWVAPDGVTYNEFDHRSYEENLKRFERCQQLAKEKLGFTFHTFGPPGTGAKGDAMDENAWKALAATPDITLVYYGPMDDAGKKLEAETKLRLLTRVWKVNIEWPLFKPNSEQFRQGLAQYSAGRDYFFLQGHPQHWDEAGFAEFVKIVDIATAQGCPFTTPSEYAASHPVAGKTTTAAVPPARP